MSTFSCLSLEVPPYRHPRPLSYVTLTPASRSASDFRYDEITHLWHKSVIEVLEIDSEASSSKQEKRKGKDQQLRSFKKQRPFSISGKQRRSTPVLNSANTQKSLEQPQEKNSVTPTAYHQALPSSLPSLQRSMSSCSSSARSPCSQWTGSTSSSTHQNTALQSTLKQAASETPAKLIVALFDVSEEEPKRPLRCGCFEHPHSSLRNFRQAEVLSWKSKREYEDFEKRPASSAVSLGPLTFSSKLTQQKRRMLSNKIQERCCHVRLSCGRGTSRREGLCSSKNGEWQLIPIARPLPTGDHRVALHPSLLSTLSQLHQWVFGAIAELVHNSVEANSSSLWITLQMKWGREVLTVVDDGCGMDERELRGLLTFGKDIKVLLLLLLES